MKKYIEAIIEIVLEHVTCLHQEIEEHPRGPKYDDVTYGIDDEHKFPYTHRKSKGIEIHAACGQLGMDGESL